MIEIPKPERTFLFFKPPGLKNTYLPPPPEVCSGYLVVFHTGLIGLFQQFSAVN